MPATNTPGVSTSTGTSPREAAVQAAVREISHIATLPEITLKIVELVENPKSTAQDLNKIISTDPALCARILKVVNSSFYGLPGQIGSINRAIVMLGLNAVKNIAIAASLAKMFRGGDIAPGFAARDLWNHSIATAAIAKVLADTLKFALSDEAFLAGLIHDIGVMVEMQSDRGKLVEVIEKVAPNADGVPSGDFLAAEEQVFGATHQDFGMGLCEKWKFPKSFMTVCGYHHRPLEAQPELRMLTSMIYVADRLAAETAGGFRLDLANTNMDPAVLDQLGLSAEKLADLRNNLDSTLKNVAAVLG